MLADVRKELDGLKDDVTTKLDMATLSTSLPLVSSCLHETLRLATSSFSIRIVEEDYFLPIGEPEADVEDDSDEKAAVAASASASGYVIPAGARIICATRVPHVDEQRWGPDAWSFDGRRFEDREGEGTERSKRAREVRGFGGGISMVRSFVSLSFKMADSFPDFVVRGPTPSDSRAQGLPRGGAHRV